jgi:hypothetical protein
VGDRRGVDDDQDRRWEAEGARDRRRGVEGDQDREVEEGLRTQHYGLTLKLTKQQRWKRLSLSQPFQKRESTQSWCRRIIHLSLHPAIGPFIQRYRAVPLAVSGADSTGEPVA